MKSVFKKFGEFWHNVDRVTTFSILYRDRDPGDPTDYLPKIPAAITVWVENNPFLFHVDGLNEELPETVRTVALKHAPDVLIKWAIDYFGGFDKVEHECDQLVRKKWPTCYECGEPLTADQVTEFDGFCNAECEAIESAADDAS